MTVNPNSYSYDDAILALDAKDYIENHKWLKVQSNTYIRTAVDTAPLVVEVRHHETIVARLYADGVVRIDNGGRFSETTKRRINAVLAPLQCKIVGNEKGWKAEEPGRYSRPYRDNMYFTYAD